MLQNDYLLQLASEQRLELEKTILDLRQQLHEANTRLNETYTDDNGTVWTVPTPWAYAQACKALAKEKTKNGHDAFAFSPEDASFAFDPEDANFDLDAVPRPKW